MTDTSLPVDRVEEIRARLANGVIHFSRAETATLLADHDRLQRENAELRADKARLDWMIAHQGRVGYYDGWHSTHDDGEATYATARAAIDAAITNPSTTPSV